MKSLKDERPPPYKHFMAFDEKTSDLFLNFLIYSEHNKFYIAGKPFTKWQLI